MVEKKQKEEEVDQSVSVSCCRYIDTALFWAHLMPSISALM